MATNTDVKKEITQKSDNELKAIVEASREALRNERFKEKFTRKAGLIRAEKRKIARALTELNARQRSQQKS